MAYDEVLAERIRDRLKDQPGVSEKKMFGGTDAALARAGVRPFDLTGRPMRGWIIVAGEALDDDVLYDWIAAAGAFVATLPAK